MIVDMSSMILCSDYKDMDKKEEMEIRRLCSEVSLYLMGYSWCKKIDKVWFAGGFSKVAVFYVELLALGYENKLWVVNGDLPMAHLVTDDDPAHRLELVPSGNQIVCQKGNVLNPFPVKLHQELFDLATFVDQGG